MTRPFKMSGFLPEDCTIPQVHQFLLGGVAPRPIALVSTVDTKGNRNLSPFSFFNAFGANPPTVAFSAARRGRDGSFKDTYRNLMDTKECVIQSVTHDMVQQVSLSSTEYGPEVDEFLKSGLTPVASDIVKPDRVQESPFQMECILKQMIHLGEKKGSGNLAICEVIKFHVADKIIQNGIIEPDLINLVGRNSGAYYTLANQSAIFTVEKPLGKQGIGFDKLPESVLISHILSANNLAQLANSESIPTDSAVPSFLDSLTKLKSEYAQQLAKVVQENSSDNLREQVERIIVLALEHNDSSFAWHAIIWLQKTEQEIG